MPELPEVQILVNQLALRLEGTRVKAVEVRDPKIKLTRDVVGRRIQRVLRRGKNIIFDLSGGLHLLVHLRMTGWFEFARAETLPRGDSNREGDGILRGQSTVWRDAGAHLR